MGGNKIVKKGDTLCVGCVYRSNSGNEDNNDLLPEMLDEVVNKNYSHLLIMGDFNYPDIEWKTQICKHNDQSSDTKFLNCVRYNYLYQHITEPTRYRLGEVPHILDLVISNEEGMITDIKYDSALGKSDHLTLSFNFQCYYSAEGFIKKVLVYNKGNYDAIRNELSRIDWEVEFNNEYHEHDVNRMWTTF